MGADLKVFVYGTLKSGYHNHDRCCQGVAKVEKARVIGRLYDVGVGFPALEIPAESILEEGSGDHLNDLAVQQEYRSKHEGSQNCTHLYSLKVSPATGDWGYVYGEVLTFRYPAQQFAGLDRLEGFYPSGGSLYNRVLVLAEWNEKTEPVWTYIMDDFAGKERILDGIWR